MAALPTTAATKEIRGALEKLNRWMAHITFSDGELAHLKSVADAAVTESQGTPGPRVHLITQMATASGTSQCPSSRTYASQFTRTHRNAKSSERCISKCYYTFRNITSKTSFVHADFMKAACHRDKLQSELNDAKEAVAQAVAGGAGKKTPGTDMGTDLPDLEDLLNLSPDEQKLPAHSRFLQRMWLLMSQLQKCQE